MKEAESPSASSSKFGNLVDLASSDSYLTENTQNGLPDDQKPGRERDLAFAVSAIESGYLSRKQLTSYIKDWTIHGDRSLQEHLIAKSGLNPQECASIEESARLKLNRAQSSIVEAEKLPDAAMEELMIRYLDEHGKVASCLGLKYEAVESQESQIRSSMSRFRLLKKLGQGGLGIVWLARDEQLNRLVALKEIPRKADEHSPEVQRFRREAEITGRLEHPSIVPLHQFGHDSNNDQPFYVMRYIGKRTLEDAIEEYHERRSTGIHDALQLRYLLTSFVSICQAIAYAHSKSVIHRDLKPDNIVLDSYGQVMVLDWGLAKLTDELAVAQSTELNSRENTGDSSHTQEGQVLGTAIYMSPEQATGHIDDIDERTDVYGLGAILYAILTGFGPHEKRRDSLSSTARNAELLQLIVSQEPPKTRTLNPHTPPELDAVCAKALSIKPYNRYSSALELADEIEHWLGGETVSAYEEPLTKSVPRWIGTHRLFSQFAAALLTILIVTGVTSTIISQDALHDEELARFESMKSQSRELASKVESRAEELIKNVMFMSTLPPIKGIMTARSETDVPDSESEEVWVGRLENIYTGLLRANPLYRSVSFSGIDVEDDSQMMKQIVCVERSRNVGSLIRSIPATRLQVVEDTPAIKLIKSLSPGEVYLEELSLGDDPLHTSDTILHGGIPIYREQTGELFGMVEIEIDLGMALHDMLSSLIDQGHQAYFVKNDRRILLHLDCSGEFQPGMRGESCEQLPLAVQSFLVNETAPDMISDGESFVARKIRFNELHDQNWLCLVLIAGHMDHQMAHSRHK